MRGQSDWEYYRDTSSMSLDVTYSVVGFLSRSIENGV